MNLSFASSFILLLSTVASLNPEANATKKDVSVGYVSGTALDEVVVESSLHIKKKTLKRIRKSEPTTINDDGIVRVKRQRRRFNPSQSSANAASQSNFFNGNDFGASAANAQAQGFQSGGKSNQFGASAAGTQTQSFTGGRSGLQGSAAASMSQEYHLPNGKTVNFAISNGFSNGPNGLAGSRGSSLTIN